MDKFPVDAAALIWLHDFTTGLYDLQVIVPAHHGELVRRLYKAGFDSGQAAKFYFACIDYWSILF